MKHLIQTNKANQPYPSRNFFTQILLRGSLLFLLAFSISNAGAQITAIQSGPWNDPNTWDIDIPTSVDDVIIGSGISVNINAAGAACNSLLIGDANGNGSIVFTGTSSLTVTGDVTLGDASSGTAGTISMSAAATFTCGTIIESDPGFSGVYDTNNGTIVFNGTFTLPFNLYQFNNLVVNNGVITAGGRNLPIEGNLTINTGGTLDLDANSAQRNSIGGTLTIQDGATLKIGGSGNIPANYSTHAIGATSVIEYNGVAQTVSTLNSSQNYGYLIISGSGLKEINGNIGIARDLTVNAAIFSVNTFTANRTSAGGTLTVANGATLRIAGSGTLPSNFSTHSVGATSTIEYSGTSSQNIAVLNSGQKYGHLNIFNSVKTLSGSVTIAGTLTFGGTPNRLTIGSNTLTLEGAISGSTTARSFSGSTTSNLVLTGAFARTLFFDATTIGTTNVINNLTLNHSGNTSTLGNDLVVNTNLTFTAGKLSIAARTLTLRGGITNTVTGSMVGGASSRMVFNGASSPTLSMDQTTPGTTNNLSTLQINSSGQVVTMGNNLVMSSTLTFTAGKLSINGNTLTLRGLVTNTATGGLIAGSTSSLIINGTTSPSLSFDQTTPGTTNVIRDLTVNSTSQTVTLTNALRLVGVHTPTAGIFAAGGNYTIASTAASTANVAAGPTGGGYITGNVTVERYIPQNTNRAWRLLASPTSGQTINAAWQESQTGGVNGVSGYGTNITSSSASWASEGFDFKTPSYSILSYNASSNSFVGVTNTGATISDEPGYLIYIRGNRSVTPASSIAAGAATTLRTTGTLYTGNQSAKTVLADKFALVGNPYPCALDLRNISVGGGSVGTSFYVWDPKLLGSYNIGGFQTLTESGGNYIVVPGGGSYGSTGSTVNTIESGAAFLVQATGSAGSITINEASKATGSRMVFRPTGNAPQLLNTTLLSKNNGEFVTADGAIVLFDENYSNAIDGMDSKKLTNQSENFSIVKDGANLVAEKRHPITDADTVFFKMIYLKKIDYKLQVVATNLENQNTLAFLEDSYTSTSKPLNLNDTTVYDFTVDNNAGSFASSRFRIVFKPATVLAVSFTNVNATVQNKKVVVDWKVNNQINISKYAVEKSINGRDFSSVATQAAEGINGSNSSYSWIDETPAAGISYYRIQSIDLTGSPKYSSIVKVNMDKMIPSFSISPNPAEGNVVNIQFTNQPAGRYNIRILNAGGQVILKEARMNTGTSSVQQMQLPAAVKSGVYQLELVAPDNSRQVQKLLIR